MCYMIPLICGWEWFPTRKGLVTGCILGGYGFGSFIFSQISTKIVNPDGLDPTISDPNNPDITFYGDEVADRVPLMIRTLVYIWACLAFIGFLLIFRKPQDQEIKVADEVLSSDGTMILGDQTAENNNKEENNHILSASAQTFETATDISGMCDNSASRINQDP